MKLIINGKEFEKAEGITVHKLLVQDKVSQPDMVSVELNGEILERRTFDRTILHDGDKVEFLYFMGGGNGA